MKPIRLALLAAASWCAATAAHAGPVAAAIATWASTALLFSGTVSVAASLAIYYGLNLALNVAASLLLSRLTAPSMKSAAQERQASVMTLSLGEGPREAIFGRAATGGRLLDAFNWGGTYGTDWEVLVIAVADHKCDALEGYLIGDAYYTFGGDGVQAGFNNQLEMYWKDGSPGQTASAYLVANSPSRLSGPAWTTDDVCASIAYVVVAYKADAPNAANPVWTTGRPSVKPVVRGKLCYDPRKDSTVPGGSGAHRWANPSTWEWSENARICDYNYDRGIYAEDQVDDPSMLLIGRGLSAIEAPPERVIAAANVCDETVALKAGGTEKRYRVGGAVRADEAFITVKEYFAAAMAGQIVQRNGGVEIEPGAAKSVVCTITDGDLVAGEAIHDEGFISDADRVNTVIPRYIAPDQFWQDHAAPVRRSLSDITADGGPKTRQLSLSLVTSGTQAQRCGEIERRLARKERRFGLVLPPRLAWIEDGDWISWTSDLFFGGATVTFRVEAASQGQDWRNSLTLREIASSCYDWTAATDEGTPGAAPVDEAGALDGLALTGVAIVAGSLTGSDGTSIPTIRASWDTPVDAAIRAVRLETRIATFTDVAVSVQHDPNLGVLITTDGVASGTAMQGRLIPIAADGRKTTPTSWINITTSSLDAGAISAALALLPIKNLWREVDYTAYGGAAKVDPMTLADSLWGLTFPGADTTAIVKVSPHTQGLASDGAHYSFQFKAKVNTGTAKIRCGWRTPGGATISDVPDQVFNLTTTLTRFTWDDVQSSDSAFTSAIFQIFEASGDIASGRSVTVTDVMMVYGSQSPSGWLPCPDEPLLLRYAGYLGALDATRNTIFVSSSAPSSPANGDLWVDTSTTPNVLKTRVSGAWQVSASNGGSFGNNLYRTPGGTLATLSDFLTSMGISAGFTGQGPWATESTLTPSVINGRTQYLDASTGKLTNVQGLGAPVSGMGQALTVNIQPLSTDDTHVYIAAFTVSGFGGYSRSFSAYTFSGMPSGNGWYIIVYWPTGGYGLASNSDLNGYLASGDWFLLGLARTSSSGSYSPPSATTPGVYAGSGANPLISTP